jgi:hypothetical protein
MLVWRTIYHDLGRELGLCEVIVYWIVLILILDVGWLYDHGLMTLLFVFGFDLHVLSIQIFRLLSGLGRRTWDRNSSNNQVYYRTTHDVHIDLLYMPLCIWKWHLYFFMSKKKKLCCSSEKNAGIFKKKRISHLFNLAPIGNVSIHIC